MRWTESRNSLERASSGPLNDTVASFVREYQKSHASLYDVRTLVRVGGRQLGADKFVRAWLDTPDAPHLLILGGYGSGKTHLSKKVAFELSQRWIGGDGNAPFPLFCPLIEARSRTSILRYLRKRLIAVGASQANSFKEVLRRSGFLFLLDGLDELQSGQDSGAIARIFDEISSLPSGSRALITARSHMFLRRDQIPGTASLGEWYELARKSGVRDFLLVAELVPFSPGRQSQYLRRRLGKRATVAKAVIETTYGLHEMAARPLFLTMIASSFDDLRRRRRASLTPWELYETYVSRVFRHREGITGVSADLLRSVSRALAREMFRLQKLRLTSTEVRHSIGQKGQNAVTTVGPGDLLLERHRSNLGFSHASLFEFFLADAILSDLGKGRTEVLRSAALGLETLSFLAQGTKTSDGARHLQELAIDLVHSKRVHTALFTNTLEIAFRANQRILRALLPTGLASNDPVIARTALKLAGYARPMVGKEQVIAQLNSRDETLRYLAIETSALHRLRDASDAVIQGIVGDDPKLRRLSLWAFRKIRSPKLVAIAIQLLDESDDPVAIRAAAEVVGKLQDENSLRPLRRALDRVPGATFYVQEALSAIRARSRFPWLVFAELVRQSPKRVVSILNGRNSPWLRRYLIDEIGERRLTNYVDHLIRIYDKQPWQIRSTVIDAMGEMRSERYTEFLRRALSAEVLPELRGNIVWALGHSGDPRAVPPVMASLNDTSAFVRDWALWARANVRRPDIHRIDDARFVYPSVNSNIA